jgi:hypothetical protein
MTFFRLFDLTKDAGTAALLMRGPGILFHRRLAARIQHQLDGRRD